MLALSRWKILLVLASALFGLIFTLPNLVPPGALPSWAPSQRLNLGLDLQGGSYLLLEVDTQALSKERLTNLTEDIRTRLKAAQIEFTGLGVQANAIGVRIKRVAVRDQSSRWGSCSTTWASACSRAGGT